MIALWFGTAWALTFDRVDLLAEAPGTWLPYEAPRLATAPEVAAIRWLGQVTPVVAAGRDGGVALEVGASLSAQSIGLRAPLFPDLGLCADAALVTRAFLPAGARIGASIRPGPIRIGLSLVALSRATWVRPDYGDWTLMPALGLGVGRDLRPRAPWMTD